MELTLEAQIIDLLQAPKTGLESESTEVKQVRLHLMRLTSLILGCCHYRFFSVRLRRTVRRGRYAAEAAKLMDSFVNKRGGRVRLEDRHFDAAPFLRSPPRPRAGPDQPESCLGASPSPLLSVSTGPARDALVGEEGRAKLRGQRRAEGRGTGVEKWGRRKPSGETSDQDTEGTPRAAVMALIRYVQMSASHGCLGVYMSRRSPCFSDRLGIYIWPLVHGSLDVQRALGFPRTYGVLDNKPEVVAQRRRSELLMRNANATEDPSC